MNEQFVKNLKKGMKFEDRVLQLLMTHFNNTWVVPTHNFKTSVSKGPRMFHPQHKDIILPDFLFIANPTLPNKTLILCEAKLKKQTFRLKGHGVRQFVAIEKWKVEDYRKAAKIFDAHLSFIIGIENKNEIHYINDSHNFVVHNFNNKYSKCDNCCIEITSSTKIANLVDSATFS